MKSILFNKACGWTGNQADGGREKSVPMDKKRRLMGEGNPAHHQPVSEVNQL
jgi:hypothetical protein